jgi:hypothetical protein
VAVVENRSGVADQKREAAAARLGLVKGSDSGDCANVLDLNGSAGVGEGVGGSQGL